MLEIWNETKRGWIYLTSLATSVEREMQLIFEVKVPSSELGKREKQLQLKEGGEGWIVPMEYVRQD